MNNKFDRLYVLKGRIGLVGDDSTCNLSFCLRGESDNKLSIHVINFTFDEVDQPPDIFLETFRHKVDNLLKQWIKHLEA